MCNWSSVRRKNGADAIFEEIVAEKFLKHIKEVKLYIQEVL